MTSVLARFWQKVEKNGPTVLGMTLRCWEWTGAIDNEGYPRFKCEGVSMLANRARFVLEGVPIGPEDHMVTLCRNKRCVRPEHHTLGTSKDARQLGQGGRYGPGDQFLVRKLFAEGEIDAEMIAECYGVSQHVAEAILQEANLL